jgi:hypothetical protein
MNLFGVSKIVDTESMRATEQASTGEYTEVR